MRMSPTKNIALWEGGQLLIGSKEHRGPTEHGITNPVHLPRTEAPNIGQISTYAYRFVVLRAAIFGWLFSRACNAANLAALSFNIPSSAIAYRR